MAVGKFPPSPNSVGIYVVPDYVLVAAIKHCPIWNSLHIEPRFESRLPVRVHVNVPAWWQENDVFHASDLGAVRGLPVHELSPVLYLDFEWDARSRQCFLESLLLGCVAVRNTFGQRL